VAPVAFHALSLSYYILVGKSIKIMQLQENSS
jgi:hypothetical protein